MPVFIWKGHPSLAAGELATIHHYSSAPLALLPLGLLLAGVAQVFPVVLPGPPWIMAPVIGGLVLLIYCMGAAGLQLVFMRISTHPGAGRVLLLMVYLPLHWGIMLIVTFLGVAAIMIACQFLFGEGVR